MTLLKIIECHRIFSMHMTTAGENNKALKEVALELAHEGSKDPVGCQGEGPRARKARQTA
jgi:hypothetical protein